jgi:hypothetical protein
MTLMRMAATIAGDGITATEDRLPVGVLTVQSKGHKPYGACKFQTRLARTDRQRKSSSMETFRRLKTIGEAVAPFDSGD